MLFSIFFFFFFPRVNYPNTPLSPTQPSQAYLFFLDLRQAVSSLQELSLSPSFSSSSFSSFLFKRPFTFPVPFVIEAAHARRSVATVALLHHLLAAFSGPSSSTSSLTPLAVIEGLTVRCCCWCVTDVAGIFFTAHNSRSVPKDQRARADTTPPSSLPCVFTLSFAFSPCCQEQSSVHLLPHRQGSVSGEVIRSFVVG